MSDVDFNSLPPAEQQALLNGPALQPPDGVNPNFDNPSNDDGLARKVLAVCFALGSAFVLLRAYVAWFVNKKPHFNDCKLSAVGSPRYCIRLTKRQL